MHAALQPDYAVPHDARATIAAELARYYGELAGTAARSTEEFSLARLLLGQTRRDGPQNREAEVCKAAATSFAKEYDSCRVWVPLRAIFTQRTMSTQPGSKGGYLVGVNTMQPVDVLRPWSVAAASGAQVMFGLRDNVDIPSTATAVTAGWISEGGQPAVETPPTIGGVSMSPKTAIGLVKFSLQLLRQAEAVEEYTRAMLLAAVGELLDQVFFAGAGGDHPLGLLGTPGIGTQSGASLAHAGVLAMRKTVLNAGAREERLQWVGTPAVQELLGAREAVTDTARFLWDTDGILGLTARATKNAPASALVCGDFSQAVIGVFGPGLEISVDPSQDFERAGLVARVMLMADVAFPRPEAFCVATAIS